MINKNTPKIVRFIYEDELPEDMTDGDYSIWFDNSFVDGVRMGPSLEDLEQIKQKRTIHYRLMRLWRLTVLLVAMPCNFDRKSSGDGQIGS